MLVLRSAVGQPRGSVMQAEGLAKRRLMQKFTEAIDEADHIGDTLVGAAKDKAHLCSRLRLGTWDGTVLSSGLRRSVKLSGEPVRRQLSSRWKDAADIVRDRARISAASTVSPYVSRGPGARHPSRLSPSR
jgi:hypothetical protein